MPANLEKMPENRKAKRQGDNCLIGFVPTARRRFATCYKCPSGERQLAARATFAASIRNRAGV